MPQDSTAIDQPSDSLFDPGSCFGEWLRAVENSRNRASSELPACYLEDPEGNLFDKSRSHGPFSRRFRSEGTLVVTEHGKFQGNVKVTNAVIDGIFKGKITATENIVLENHALVIGELRTPSLEIHGGAIIEGTCYFEGTRTDRWEPRGWEFLKEGLAKVWRGRPVQ
jgi:hypothetical protein